jgi:hypothetical protein
MPRLLKRCPQRLLNQTERRNAVAVCRLLDDVGEGFLGKAMIKIGYHLHRIASEDMKKI